MKLNLGCGGDIREGYVNVDIKQPCDLIHDLRQPLPYENNSIDEIMSHDFVALLDRAEWKTVLKDWVRTLKMGGTLELSVHDFARNIRDYLTSDGKDHDYWLQCIYAGQENEFDYFKNAFTASSLIRDLEQAGLGTFKILPRSDDFIHVICHKVQNPYPKILIGTPIHECKDYAVESWFASVRGLDYPNAELFLVDNSDNLDYVERLRPLFPPNIKTTIIHMDIAYVDAEERVAMAREAIRERIIKEDWDFWFSWECDTLAPPDVLKQLLPYTQVFDIVHHLSPSRHDPKLLSENSFGLSLIKSSIFKQYSFALEWGKIDPDMPNCWYGADAWFCRRVLRDGGKIVSISGLIPVNHLRE